VAVVQRLPRLDGARFLLSEDGALLAVLGTSLSLVSTADGTVRGAFPSCVVDAIFAPDDASMIVVGCPERALPPAEASRTSATTKIWRWDLRRDEVTTLAEGPFEHVRAMPNPDEVLLWGKDRVAAARLRDGALRTTLTATGTKRNELMQVSRSGTRAFASVDDEWGLIDEGGFRKSYENKLSPELDLSADIRESRLELKRTSDGVSVVSIELQGADRLRNASGRHSHVGLQRARSLRFRLREPASDERRAGSGLARREGRCFRASGARGGKYRSTRGQRPWRRAAHVCRAVPRLVLDQGASPL
jgi:hypothetical protein